MLYDFLDNSLALILYSYVHAYTYHIASYYKYIFQIVLTD